VTCCSTPSRNLHFPLSIDRTCLFAWPDSTISNKLALAGNQHDLIACSIIWTMSPEKKWTNWFESRVFSVTIRRPKNKSKIKIKFKRDQLVASLTGKQKFCDDFHDSLIKSNKKILEFENLTRKYSKFYCL
jgi:hypothetical protein